MSSFVKALLVVVGIFVLLAVAAGVGGYLWFKHNKTSLMESAKAIREEGNRFGTETDNNGCLAEAMARIKKNSGIKDQIKVKLFLTYCLKSSKSSPQFCEAVPPEIEIMKSATWRIQMCRKYELKDSNNMIFQEVQEYCDECRKKTK